MWATPTLIKFSLARKIAIVRIKKINNNNFFCLFCLMFLSYKEAGRLENVLCQLLLFSHPVDFF